MCETQEKHGLLLSRDFLFTTKITGTARELGLKMDVAASVEAARDHLANQDHSCLLIDLSMPWQDIAEFLTSLPADGRPPMIAFGSHVDKERLEQASVLGCTQVMPRSQFSATLPQILTRYLKT